MAEDQTEADYRKELEAAGVDIPENDPAEVVEPKEEPKEEETPKEDAPEEPKIESESKERVKRSIYDDYKEKKHELKSEREARERAERERDELKAKLDAASEANSPDVTTSAPSDVLEYAEQAGADPELVRRIIEARQAPVIDPEIAEDLKEFKQWKQSNAQMLDAQRFEQEFAKTVPSLQKMFPNANPEELNAMKGELDKLSHTPSMYDKELEYVAFKNQEHLSAFVSPRVRGMEDKGRNQVDDTPSEWNPNADLSKMSPKQLEAWEAVYNKAVEAEKGVVGSSKQKMFI